MADFPGNIAKLSHAEVLGSHIEADKQPKPPAPKVALSKAEAELEKLRKFLLENRKGETGNETPVDCAIRLLTKKK